MSAVKKCAQCASEDFSHDEIDMKGDGVEELSKGTFFISIFFQKNGA